jgi:outer membrane lipoprotein-sorting protein
MKKITFILSIAVIVIFSSTAAFAAGDTGKIWDELLKITEKCTDNVSYSMETKSGTASTKMKFFFKDVKNYRVDTEVEGQKTRMVYAGGKAWVYVEAQNVVTNMDPAGVESIDIKEALEKQKEIADASEGKSGSSVTYTIIERETKNKTVFTVDPKMAIYTKMQVYDGKGDLLTEAVYTDWKFAKIAADVFDKPKGAKEMDMPAQDKSESK